MKIEVIFNLIGAASLFAAELWLFINRKKLKYSKWVLAPLEISIFLYFFIAFSNTLEHSGISSFFDPFEDIAEIIFTLTFLFFINNWHSQHSIEVIKNKESWLNSAFEYLPEGILTTDASGKILFLNKEMEEMTGWHREEARNRLAGEILSFEDKETKLPLDYNPFSEILTGSVSHKFTRGINIKNRKSGKTLVMNSTSLIHGEKGEILGAVGAFRDISEFDSLTEQLNHTHKMEAMGQLAGGVAHDLNNMLGGIMGAADLLKLELFDEGISKYDDLIGIITNSTLNGRELTSNLLAFGRKGSILSTPVSINAVIEKTAAMAERTIGREYNLETEIKSDNLYIIGDPSQIQNALLNLILNARDAQPEGGTISVIAESICVEKDWCRDCELKLPDGNYVRVCVKDRGSGISPDLQKKIFEPFFTTKAEGKGTGLGLAAVYKTAISHQGRITVESRPGEGSTFNLYFPQVQNYAESGKTAAVEPSLRKGTKTILVIDDEPMLRTTISMMLDQCGMISLQAESGEKGLELFREKNGSIDAVFLDMVMPGMNGSEILVKMKEYNRDIPVILTSGFVNQDDDLPSLASGFLHKPFRINELLEVLKLCFSTKAKND